MYPQQGYQRAPHDPTQASSVFDIVNAQTLQTNYLHTFLHCTNESSGTFYYRTLGVCGVVIKIKDHCIIKFTSGHRIQLPGFSSSIEISVRDGGYIGQLGTNSESLDTSAKSLGPTAHIPLTYLVK